MWESLVFVLKGKNISPGDTSWVIRTFWWLLNEQALLSLSLSLTGTSCHWHVLGLYSVNLLHPTPTEGPPNASYIPSQQSAFNLETRLSSFLSVLRHQVCEVHLIQWSTDSMKSRPLTKLLFDPATPSSCLLTECIPIEHLHPGTVKLLVTRTKG